MIITEDEKHIGDFKARVKDGESIRVRPQLDWNDKNAGLTMEYWLGEERILSRRIEKKWYWYFMPNALEREVQEFYNDGMKRAVYIKDARLQSLKMVTIAKNLYQDE